MTFLHRQTSSKAFTIVELAIVISVIGILASISIVSYKGYQERARAAAAIAGVNQATDLLEAYQLKNSGLYPSTLAAAGVTNNNSVEYQYSQISGGTNYCVTATSKNVSYKMSQDTEPTAGGCAGHGSNGVSAVTNLVTNPSFENNVSGWNALGGSSLVTDSSWSVNGTKSVLITASTSSNDSAAQLGGYDNATFNLQPSTTYTISAYSRVVGVGTGAAITNGSRQVTVWVNNGSAYTVYRGNQVSNSAGATARSQVTFTTPSAITQAFVRLYWGYSTGSVQWDAVMFNQGGTTYTYADGNLPNWVWNGVANDSTSTGPPV